MKKKKDICVRCGHYRWIYAKKLCQFCYKLESYYRSQERKKKKALESDFKGELDMFNQIWGTRQRESFLSNKILHLSRGSQFFPNMFAHVLSKNKYPLFRFNPDNIVLVTPAEHFAMDFYDEEKQKKLHPECNWTKLSDLRNELIEEYNRLYNKKEEVSRHPPHQ